VKLCYYYLLWHCKFTQFSVVLCANCIWNWFVEVTKQTATQPSVILVAWLCTHYPYESFILSRNCFMFYFDLGSFEVGE